VRLLDRRSALLALAFFAILEPFVYYSSETKQYSFDVLLALVIFLLFDHALSSDRLRWWAPLFVVGTVAPLFSHPSIFVLAGTGIALLLAAAAARDVRKLIFVSAAGVAWLVSFAVVYVTSTRNLNPHLSTGLRGENVDPVRVLKNTYVLFNDPGTMPRDLIGLILVLVGLGALISLRDSWPRLAAMAAIAITAVLAGELRYYQLAGRWALFLHPFAVLLLALGATAFVRTTRMPLKAFAVVAVGFLLAVPAWKAVRNLERVPTTEPGTPATQQPTRSLLGRLEPLWKPGDTLYVSVKSQFQFRYYLTCDDCNAGRASQFQLWPFRPVPGPLQTSPALVPERPNLVVGQAPGDLDSYLDDFERLSGKPRVWLLLTQTWPVDEALLEDELSRQGRPLTVIHEGASALLLYDFRPRASAG
jgi:4-amino-4-deoxy-L-arabinose transferase-like glycosyltransferase